MSTLRIYFFNFSLKQFHLIYFFLKQHHLVKNKTQNDIFNNKSRLIINTELPNYNSIYRQTTMKKKKVIYACLFLCFKKCF